MPFCPNGAAVLYWIPGRVPDERHTMETTTIRIAPDTPAGPANPGGRVGRMPSADARDDRLLMHAPKEERP